MKLRYQRFGPAATVTPYTHKMLRTEPGWTRLLIEDWPLIEHIRMTGRLTCGSFGDSAADYLPTEGYLGEEVFERRCIHLASYDSQAKQKIRRAAVEARALAEEQAVRQASVARDFAEIKKRRVRARLDEAIADSVLRREQEAWEQEQAAKKAAAAERRERWTQEQKDWDDGRDRKRTPQEQAAWERAAQELAAQRHIDNEEQKRRVERWRQERDAREAVERARVKRERAAREMVELEERSKRGEALCKQAERERDEHLARLREYEQSVSKLDRENCWKLEWDVQWKLLQKVTDYRVEDSPADVEAAQRAWMHARVKRIEMETAIADAREVDRLVKLGSGLDPAVKWRLAEQAKAESEWAWDAMKNVWVVTERKLKQAALARQQKERASA